MDDLIIFSVFEITQHLKQVIETQIEPLYVRGEISNYTHHSSGHIYFNLKDANATLRCTFFRHANLHLDFRPEEGMEVVAEGQRPDQNIEVRWRDESGNTLTQQLGGGALQPGQTETVPIRAQGTVTIEVHHDGQVVFTETMPVPETEESSQ